MSDPPGCLMNFQELMPLSKLWVVASFCAPALTANLVYRIRQAKRELSEFVTVNALYREDNAPLLEKRIIRWLNEHPAPSRAGECAWCGKLESPDGTVLPFGTEPETHTWLHPECWSAWHWARRRQAIDELTDEHERQ